MNCTQCKPLLRWDNFGNVLPAEILEVELCAVHELTERLAEALRFHHPRCDWHKYCDKCELLKLYDSAKGKS